MEKGVIRFEANVSIHKVGSDTLNTRTEIKNLNSFKSLVRSIKHEIERQKRIYASGGTVEQQTLGWNEGRSQTVAQRSKEHAHDYRYFTEPDLPPLQITRDWVGEIRDTLPELPDAKHARFIDLGLNDYEASVLASDRTVANYFERVIESGSSSEPPLMAKAIANWISSQMFGLMKAANVDIDDLHVNPDQLAELIGMVESGMITARTGKLVLKESFKTGEAPITIVEAKGLAQVSDEEYITKALQKVLSENPDQIAEYLSGKETVSKWLFGQVMQETRGKASPQVLQRVLDAALAELKSGNGA
jgi:aspartyl-tRNA(Asn)/glutamyl-tRNA(Gln) amidotransferase subunit B